jgi:predicted DNA-binding protein (MmcQ/YjbR family)
MISFAKFQKLALSFQHATEEPHFEKTSFRLKKKIFATYDAKKNRACLKLSLKDQDLFSVYDKNIIYPVPNSWGKQGWTFVELKNVPANMFADALKAAYTEIAK